MNRLISLNQAALALCLAMALLFPPACQKKDKITTGPLTTDPKLAPVLPPLTPPMLESIRSIYKRGQAAGMRKNVFAKMGDSITAYREFMSGIGNGEYDVGRHWEILPALDRFSIRDLGGGRNSFNRTSHAAVRAWGAEHALQVDLSGCKAAATAVECEIHEIKPAFALVMFGTNNVDRNLPEFIPAMGRITDILISRGVIPILCTIPDAPWTARAAEEAHIANREMLRIGLERKIPVINYWRAMQDLPDRGLSHDGVHPSVAPEGSGWFTEEGLKYGHNMRAYLFLVTLKKLMDALD